jgi:16S rRNA (cytosine1402-N4)-methyltransferase
VLLKEVLEGLDMQKGDLVLDATAGQGGHSFAVLSENPGVSVLALDADPEAVVLTRTRLEKFKNRATVVESNFEHVEKVLHKQGIKEINRAIFDLGWNSGQLFSGRGFSFQYDEPLSMSYGPEPASGFNAREIVNEWEEKTLADVIFGYSEEQYARRIANAIVERRKFSPIETTIELAELVRDAVPPGYRHGRIHPATKTFQSLRIAVNDELGVIERGLEGAWKHLASGGRIAVITFHSTEDRLVKQIFLKYSKEGGRLVTKKPQVPSRSEIIHNPRARSAKLRIIEKICEQ